MNPNRLRQFAGIILIYVVMMAGALALTDDGVIIDNQVQMTYVDAATGATVVAVSNVASVSVSALYRFNLPDNRTIESYGGQKISAAHRILNTGNIEDTYRITLRNSTGDSYDLEYLSVYLDLNGNGLVDADESLLQQLPAVSSESDDVPSVTETFISYTPLIGAGESIDVVVQGIVPVLAQDGSAIDLELITESLNSDLPSQTNHDRILIVGSAHMALEKRTEPSCDVAVYPGESIVYHVDYTNTGDRPIASAPLFIDGVEHHGLVIANELPGNTLIGDKALAGFSDGATTLVVQNITDANRWISLDSWDGQTPVTHIGLFLPEPSLVPSHGGSYHYGLHVTDVSSDVLKENQAFIDIHDDGRHDYESNRVCNTLAIPSAASVSRLSFVSPALALRQNGMAPDFYSPEDFVNAGLYRLDNAQRDYDLVRDGVYLELSLELLDPTLILRDANNNRYLVVELASERTGDRVWVVLLETENNSGIFRNVVPVALNTELRGADSFCPGNDGIPAVVEPQYSQSVDECVLLSSVDDRLIARFGNTDASFGLDDIAVVDPISTVFDALTLEPVAGAVVSFIDMSSGEVVNDFLSGSPLSLTTDSQGHYSLPQLESGIRYYVHVDPPADYLFPSTAISRNYEGFQVGQFSFGREGRDGLVDGSFLVTHGEFPSAIDIPLDPVALDTQLLIEKRSLLSQVAPGEVVAYEIKTRNAGDSLLSNLRIRDSLPFGFRYVPDSAVLDGDLLANPTGGAGPQLVFNLGESAAEQSHTLTYLLEATAGSIDSDGVNTAQAFADIAPGVRLWSPETHARVRIRQSGVLSDNAALFGKVYIDANCDRLQESGDWPIGGVKLYMEDGTFAITDENGQYSLYGLNPGRHVLRIDPLSMPAGLELKPLDNRNAAQADSRFVDLSAGDFHRADFSAGCPTEDIDKIFDEIRQRNKKISSDWMLGEAERYNPSAENSNRDLNVGATDSDGDLSNGILNGPDAGRTRTESQLDDDKTLKKQVAEGVDASVLTHAPDPKEAVKNITQAQAKEGTWLWPTGETSLEGRFIVVVRSGIDPVLFVNDVEISNTQIGERIVNNRENAQIVAWYGIRLNPGENRVEVRGQDSFGNNRVLAAGNFKQPSQGMRMVLTARSDTLTADGGRSYVPLEINILDTNGYTAQGVYFVTLEASDGQWLEPDIQANQIGHQVKIVDGKGIVNLRSSDYTGNIIVRARTGTMEAEKRLFQTAALRPLFGIGTVDIGARYSNVKKGRFGPTDQADGLKKGTALDARVALFLKGRVSGDRHLTLSYDSEKSNSTDLLRDINPNAHYPVHGDASVRGYEAQSRSKLYAKLEKGKNSIMWGDYRTDANKSIDDLTRVQRTLTGLNGLYDNDVSRIQVFAARPESVQRVEEIRGNGTRMLFRLTGAPLVANSEVVEFVVRDRDNTGIVLSSRVLSRFGDYILDSVTGQLKFSSVIPTLDEDGNPVSIRVSYDVEGEGEEHTVAGFRLQHTLVSNLQVGLSYTHDDDPQEGYRLVGANAEFKPGDQTSVTVGIGRMSHFSGRQSGVAQRIAASHGWKSGGRALTQLSWARADEGFDNPGAGVSAGREELRLHHRHQISNTFRANFEGLRSRSLTALDTRDSIGVTLEKAINDWTLHAGTKHIRLQTAESEEFFNTLLLGVDRRFSWRGRIGSVKAEYEQDVADVDRRRFLFSGKLPLHDTVHLYGRYEIQDGLGSLSSLDSNSSSNFA
ncbi:MAG: DUF11 domain-containing protein, partial [Granulosicoccus sp.]|nr:DUF11 domain-containing protein [Granulosicoccus sp.]